MKRSRRSSRTSRNWRPLRRTTTSSRSIDVSGVSRPKRRMRYALAALRASPSVLCFRRFSTSRYVSHAAIASPNVGTSASSSASTGIDVCAKRAWSSSASSASSAIAGVRCARGHGPRCPPDHRPAASCAAVLAPARAWSCAGRRSHPTSSRSSAGGCPPRGPGRPNDRFGSTRPLWLTPPAGFEPATCGLEVRCSIQLSYRGLPAELSRVPAAQGRTRTRTSRDLPAA